MSKRQIKLGFIGLGFIGTIHSIACFSMPLIFKNLPFEVKLGPVCKNNTEDIPHFFEKGVKSIEEMLEECDVDAVDICTPNYLHYEQAMKAIEKGIPLYLEKPMGVNGKEAYEIMEKAKEKRLIHQTALMYRFMPAVNQARDMIKNGEIGEILNFKALMLHSGYMDPKRPMSWKMKKATSGGGAIVDMGIHLVDAVRFMIGEIKSLRANSKTYFKKRPVSKGSDIYEEVDVDDWTSVEVEMENGGWGSIEASRISPDLEEETIFEIYGTKGSIKITTKQPRYAILYKKQENIQIIGDYDKKSKFSEYSMSIYPPEKYSLGWMVDLHMASLINFFTNIVEGKIVFSETPTFDEAYKDQLILDKILLSAENNGKVISI
ncbi:Gfo/Idh/MocA family oxidoreductase [Thermoanaerobacter sp. CM-CNRG TB177]|uniref:Gfo/Idh/MocA family protein n=1 Tax=Thermoanaerobacter sp. CM-CNRG TB177 TaxID=2800659 RepID=UPI001BDE42B7|nr:Gfo/Idh/MocA family oxidoreductase [Thermoanaerobacter sp. CM-CNRG TB177]MBT1280058.1 Gfo/Idh/MocA family oxidoreductase [Thermoanaerobacter sp. CM-CNRG TB177]